MSDQASATTPQADEVNAPAAGVPATPTEDNKPASTAAASTAATAAASDSAPNVSAAAAAVPPSAATTTTTSSTAEEANKAGGTTQNDQQAAAAKADSAADETKVAASATPTPAATKAQEENLDKKVDSSGGANKGDEMVTDNAEAESEKPNPADESDVKMETSTTEDSKTNDEKANDETTVTQSTNKSTQPPLANAATNAAAVAPQPVPETKEASPVTKHTNLPANEKNTSSVESTKTMGTRQYLDATVVPILHTALSHLAKQRPENPVAFLGQFLLDNQDKFANSK